MSANKKSFINDLTEGSVAKQLFVFAVPFMLSNLLQTVYNLVDMAVVLGTSLAVWMTALPTVFYYLSGKWKTYKLAVHQ